MELSREQKLRFNRQIILDGFGIDGQKRLMQSKVLLIGVGGLGAPAALYLAAAGVGCLGLVDGDVVSLTNLQRQVIHFSSDVGNPKVDSAKNKLLDINPDLKVDTFQTFLTQSNATELIAQYDFIIDCTDNFATKYLVNDACVFLNKPFCIGGINRYSGQVMTHLPNTACYRCLFPEPPLKKDVETCSTVGVLGSIAGILGTIQATECIKYLANVGSLLINSLLVFDTLSMQWQNISFPKESDCPLCGCNPTITKLEEYAFQPCNKKI